MGLSAGCDVYCLDVIPSVMRAFTVNGDNTIATDVSSLYVIFELFTVPIFGQP